MPPPSLAGHPVILNEICSYSTSSTLARLLRVDKQLFDIAGRMLYRYLAYKPSLSVPSPFHSYIIATPGRFAIGSHSDPSSVQTKSLINPLLNFIEVLEVTEEDAVNLSDDFILHGSELPCMDRLKTLIIRSKDGPYEDEVELDCDLFLVGCKPERMVVIGGLSSLLRITGYRRSDGGRTCASQKPTQNDMLWPTVHSLLHIIPYNDRYHYPGEFILRTPDREITTTFPALEMYEVFFDINYIIRFCGAVDIGPRDECNLARTITWIIRNTRADLPITVWANEEIEGFLLARQGLISQTVRRPYSLADYETIDREPCKEWKKEQFDARVGHVKTRFCGKEREAQLCMAADEVTSSAQPSRLLEYVDSMTGNGPDDQTPEENGKKDDGGFQLNFDWSMTAADDDEEDEDFSMDEEDEDEDEEDDGFESESDDDHRYRSRGWGGGGYDRYGGWKQHYYESDDGFSDEDEDEEDEDEDEDEDEEAE